MTSAYAISRKSGRIRLFLIVMALFTATAGMAQLKTKVKCPDFYVDILNGTVNGLKPNRALSEFKETFPCATSTDEEGTSAKCGSGAFYKDKDIYIFTQRQYVEVGPHFKGKLSLPLLGAKRGSLFTTLGNPKLKDDNWDAYEMQYGTLVLHFDAAGKVKMFQFSTKSTDALSLCE